MMALVVQAMARHPSVIIALDQLNDFTKGEQKMNKLKLSPFLDAILLFGGAK